MLKPHFYLIPSSLGMKNRLIADDPQAAAWVATGPEEISEQLKLSELGEVTLTEINNWQENQKPRYKIIADDYQAVNSQIEATLAKDEFPIIIGGDHSTSLPAVMSAVNQAQTQGMTNTKDMGILMFDSHTDLHQPSTSPSLNFHGMWLRPIFDQFENESIEQLFPQKIPHQNLLFVGDNSTDFELAELEYIQQNNIKKIDRQAYLNNPTDFINQIQNFINQFTHLHFTFDLDFIDSREVAVNIKNEAGFTSAEFKKIIDELYFHQITDDIDEQGNLVPKYDQNMTHKDLLKQNNDLNMTQKGLKKDFSAEKLSNSRQNNLNKTFSLSISEFNPQLEQTENSLQVIDFLIRKFL